MSGMTDPDLHRYIMKKSGYGLIYHRCIYELDWRPPKIERDQSKSV